MGYWESYSDSMIWHFSIEALAGIDQDYAVKQIVRVMDDVGCKLGVKAGVHRHFEKATAKFRAYSEAPTLKERESEALMELAKLSSEFVLRKDVPPDATQQIFKACIGGICSKNDNVRKAALCFIESVSNESNVFAASFRQLIRNSKPGMRDFLLSRLEGKIPHLAELRNEMAASRLLGNRGADGRFVSRQRREFSKVG